MEANRGVEETPVLPLVESEEKWERLPSVILPFTPPS